MAAFDVNTAANIATAGTLLAALIFGILQYRQVEQTRRDEAALAVLQAFQTPEFTRAINLVVAQPERVSPEAIAQDPSVADAAGLAGTTFESLGVAVYRRVVPLGIVQDMMGTGVVLAWRRLLPHIEKLRADNGAPSIYEWFQWLAERLEANQPSYKEQGAQVAFRDWQP